MASGGGGEIDEPITYWECRRNHAAPIGRYALDGCCEYIKERADNDGTPEALLCGACGCHRSFHRKGGPPEPRRPEDPHPLPLSNAGGRITAATATATEDDSGEVEETMTTTSRSQRRMSQPTRDQKTGLTRFADRLGWRIRRHDQEEVVRFCSEIGISMSVFKAWLSNNRHRRDTDKDA